MSLLIGVDIGTQGTKAALFEADGKALASVFVASKLHRPSPGVVEEDPQQQVKSVCASIRRCMAEAKVDPSDVVGIGIDGQMAGVIGIGSDGRPVTPYDSWLDTRCGPYIEKMERAAGTRIIAKTGCATSFNHGPKMLWWKHERPKQYRRIAAFVQPGAYATMQLCGLDAGGTYIDHTYLHFSGFADNRRRRWDASLCDTFEMDARKLPRICEPHEIVGELTRSAARRCGLRAGVPMVAGCGDTAASFLAAGAVRPSVCVDVAGTASVFAATTDAFVPDRRQRVLVVGRSATPGLWHPYAYINGGGMNLEWFTSQILDGQDVQRRKPTFESLNRQAERIEPDAADVMFVPHMGGRVSPPQPHLRGAWVGLGWDANPAALWRAILESVALEYGIYQQRVRALYPKLKWREMRITGGGECSAAWNRIKADALQINVRRIDHPHGAPMGAAMLAGFGVGVFKSLESAARQWVHVGHPVRPHRRLAGHYDLRRQSYEQLLRTLDGAIEP